MEKAVPKDDPKRMAMNRHLDWLKGQGCQFSSLKTYLLDAETTIVLTS